MFLFKPQHVDMICDGSKTETRRITARRRAKPDSLHWAQTGMRADQRFARIRVTEVSQERLRNIDHLGAIAEGYPSRIAYLDAFKKISGHLMTEKNPLVWVYKFELVEDVRAEATA